MKWLNKVALLLIALSAEAAPIGEFQIPRKMVIGVPGVGFFTDLFGAVNHFMLCEKYNLIPVVYWDDNSKYYDPENYPGIDNVWEYYFEPASHLSYTKGEIPDRNYWMPEIENISGGNYLNRRKYIHDLFSKYVKVKPEIQAKVDEFYHKNMAGKRTIAIHLRGTDRYICVKPTPLRKIIEEANKYASNDTQFFIASDDVDLFAQAVTMLNGPVISYDSFRCNSTVNEWWQFESNRGKLGEDVLIDALLMSLCDHLIYTNSSVAVASLFFNPWMTYTQLPPGE